MLPDDEHFLSMDPSQSDTEQFGVCAVDRQTTSTRAGHNASWSTFSTADEKCGRCILVHWRCREIRGWKHVFDRWSRHCTDNVIGEVHDSVTGLLRVCINVWLPSRTRDVPVRAGLPSRGGLLEDAATQAIRQVAFRPGVPRPAAPQSPAALVDLRLLARRQLAGPAGSTFTPSPEDSATAGFSLAGASTACSGPRSTSFTRRLCDCCCGCPVGFLICFTSAVESHS